MLGGGALIMYIGRAVRMYISLTARLGGRAVKMYESLTARLEVGAVTMYIGGAIGMQSSEAGDCNCMKV